MKKTNQQLTLLPEFGIQATDKPPKMRQNEIHFAVEPVAAPRMTRSDQWKTGDKKRPIVRKYHAYCDQLRLLAKKQDFVLPDSFAVTFIIRMPASWSKRKKQLMDSKPMRQTPDLDNLCKGFCDCLREQDKEIHQMVARKIWGYEGGIRLLEFKSILFTFH